MAFFETYNLYMWGISLTPFYANLGLFLLILNLRIPTYREFDLILLYQNVSAIIQLILLALLCPRSWFVEDIFVVSLRGPAENFDSFWQHFCFAILVGLATNNGMTIAILFYHRLRAILGQKITERRATIFLATGLSLYLIVMILLMFPEDLASLSPELLDHNNTTEKVPHFGYNISTWGATYVKSVTLCSVPIVLFVSASLGLYAKLLLSELTASETTKRMHGRLLQGFFIQAAIPCCIGLVNIVWFHEHKKVFQVSPWFECFLFGVVPLLLGSQALITITSIDRYKHEFNWLLFLAFAACVALFFLTIFVVFPLVLHLIE